MSENDPSDNELLVAYCPECQTGLMTLKHITYFTWLNGELVTAPNFPAWICDMCGRREYDARAVKWLNILLSPEAGRNKPRRRDQSHGTGPLHP